MKFDRGIIFLATAGLALIVLIIALAAAVVIGPQQPSSMSGRDEGPLLGSAGVNPEPARPIMKHLNYPGISTKYDLDGNQPIGTVQGYLAGQPVFGKELELKNDGTVTITIEHSKTPITCGHWYKIKGKGHTIFLTIDSGLYTVSNYYISLNGFAGSAQIVNQNGQDYFSLNGIGFTGGSFNDWDAGYENMSLPVSSLGQYIDCCIPADTARPYVEKSLTGEQGVPYMQYNVPPETAEYFAKRGITGDLCGPYYAAGVSLEDTVAYLDSGFTADQIMPYARAGVHESDVMTYLNVGVTYDRAKPYIDAKAPAGAAAPYAASTFSSDQCMPFINAGIEIIKARPFLLFNIPADQAVVYINNGITASTAKPYVDAGVPAEKAVEEIKQGIPPAV